MLPSFGDADPHTPLVRIKKKRPQEGPSARINEQIRSAELRVLVEETGVNMGVVSREVALAEAARLGTDLIEISAASVPPVAKIMDYGKWQYLENKKAKAAREKAVSTETKSIQIKIGTGDHDLLIKSQKASEFLQEGHRVKIELYLKGRSKFMDRKFHEARLARVLHLITEPYKQAGAIMQGPKGLMLILEHDKAKKAEAKAELRAASKPVQILKHEF